MLDIYFARCVNPLNFVAREERAMKNTEQQSFRDGFRTILVVTLLVVVLAIPAVSRGQSSADLVLEYGHIHHMLAEQDSLPLLRIYADGLVKVHYPAYMSRAGDYELLLSRAELMTLLNQIGNELSAIDFEGGWVDFPRPKTGIERRCKLWPIPSLDTPKAILYS